MTITFSDIAFGERLVVAGDAAVVALEAHGETSATLTFLAADGDLISSVDDLVGISEISARRRTSTSTVPCSVAVHGSFIGLLDLVLVIMSSLVAGRAG